MKVEANAEYIRQISQEIYEISRQLGRTVSDLEKVERELKKQTEFGTCIRALRKTGDQVAQERYQVSSLAQALDHIGTLYQKTETAIEERLESEDFGYRMTETANMDLSGISDKVNTLLYGGEG